MEHKSSGCSVNILIRNKIYFDKSSIRHRKIVRLLFFKKVQDFSFNKSEEKYILLRDLHISTVEWSNLYSFCGIICKVWNSQQPRGICQCVIYSKFVNLSHMPNFSTCHVIQICERVIYSKFVNVSCIPNLSMCHVFQIFQCVMYSKFANGSYIPNLSTYHVFRICRCVMYSKFVNVSYIPDVSVCHIF